MFSIDRLDCLLNLSLLYTQSYSYALVSQQESDLQILKWHLIAIKWSAMEEEFWPLYIRQFKITHFIFYFFNFKSHLKKK